MPTADPQPDGRPPGEHPDAERIAAWQAGERVGTDAAALAEHLRGCPRCADQLARVARARELLAAQPEPELPAGLHERLVAAAEPGGAGGSPGKLVPLRRPARRRWGAVAVGLAAAVVGLAVLAGVRNLHAGPPARPSAAGATAATAAPALLPAPTGHGPPAFHFSGRVTPGTLRALLDRQPLRTAYAAALVGHVPSTAGNGALSASGTATATRRGATCGPPVGRIAGPGGRAAFVVQATWAGRPATIVVAVPALGAPGPGGAVTVLVVGGPDCAGPPLAVLHSTAGALGLG